MDDRYDDYTDQDQDTPVNNLADLVIQANAEEAHYKQEMAEEESRTQTTDHGQYFIDDLGFKVEKDIRKYPQRFGEYIAFRCTVLNPQLYKDGDDLYNQGRRILPTVSDICQLADMPTGVKPPIASWVYNRLMDRVPILDRNRIYLGSGLVWNRERAMIEDLSTLTNYTVLKKGETIGRKDGDARTRLEHYINNNRDSRRGGRLYSIHNN